ncbi:heme NO-binding domain-containing protein [Pseudoalteromonas espejiana]
MKGIIFRGLEALVIEKCGMAARDSLLSKNAPDGRVYISAQSYPDEELVGLAQDVAAALDMTMPQVLKAFGEYLFSHLQRHHPVIVEGFDSFAELIMGIDEVIHIEVAKLYQEPNLPSIRCEHKQAGKIVMHYHSKRQLCMCAEGLIYGAAAHYGINVSLNHKACMHDGYDECVIEVNYGAVNE